MLNDSSDLIIWDNLIWVVIQSWIWWIFECSTDKLIIRKGVGGWETTVYAERRCWEEVRWYGPRRSIYFTVLMPQPWKQHSCMRVFIYEVCLLTSHVICPLVPFDLLSFTTPEAWCFSSFSQAPDLTVWLCLTVFLAELGKRFDLKVQTD